MTLDRSPTAPLPIPGGGAVARRRGALVRRWEEYREDRERAADVAFVAAERRAEALDLRWRFRAACERLGLGTSRVAVAGAMGAATAMPVVERVDWIDGAPCLRLVMPPGFRVDELRAVADGLAEALGVRRVTFERAEHHRVRATLHRSDPLDRPDPPAGAPSGNLVIGRVESGITLSIPPDKLPHMAVQGSTGSGKSIFTYGLLSQLAGRADVELWCSDPTGILARPWPRSPHRVSGLRDVQAHMVMLAALVDELDRRLTLMPEDADEITERAGLPLIVCVLEEYPGLLRAADQLGDKGATGKAIRGYVSRLLAEARKVRIRVVLLVQRAEANVIGGFERSNLPLRLSFRVDNADSVKLLHPDPPPDVVAEHITSGPGIALVSAPGLPLTRLRAPLVTFGQYAAAIRAATT